MAVQGAYRQPTGKLLVSLAHRIQPVEVNGRGICPGDPGLAQLYDVAETGDADPERPESLLGVPAVTAALIATLQAMEVLKILLCRGRIFRRVMAHIDLENGRFEEFRFGDDRSAANPET